MDRELHPDAPKAAEADATSATSSDARPSRTRASRRGSTRQVAPIVSQAREGFPGASVMLNPRLRTARWLAAASGLVLAGFVGGEARAVEAPSDPVAKAAFDALDKHCSRCHQEDRLTGSRLRPAKNFGNVLKLDEIAKTPALVTPGNPDGSKLFNQIANKEMPYDLYYEGATDAPEVAEGDVKALRAWIENLGATTAAACESRPFVGDKDIVQTIADDLEKMREFRVKGTRYVTLTHLHNACADDKEMEVYRQAVVKLLNSLGRSSDVVKLETVDQGGTILRLHLDDLGWSEDDWNTVLAVYPYGVKPDTKLFDFIKGATGNELPYVRGDWLAFTASQPPLYDKLLKLPADFDGLQKELKVDVEENIKKFAAQRAGFQKSGVSQNNRLIERHQISTGYFWTSYDFAGNKSNQSLFKHPTGPKGENAFKHDGGESIWSLANGFQGYSLTTAEGKKLDKGPTQIVRDLSRKDLTVTNGISCIGCHDQGIRKARDDVRAQVLADRTFSAKTRRDVEALYPTHDKMDAILEGDAKRFADAMKRAGLDPTLKLNGIEMINALAAKYEANVDQRLAAAELGLSAEQFKDAANQAGGKAFALVRRLDQNIVPRDQFEADFPEFVKLLTDEEPLDLKNVAGAAADAGDKKEEKAEKKDEPAKPEKKKEVAKVKPAAKEVARTFDLSLTSDRSTYKQNDRPVFAVVAKEDCNLTLINVDDKGQGTVLFPNKFQAENKIKAGKEFRFGDSSTPFTFRMADVGTETVIAECNASKPATRGFEATGRDGGFTNLGDYSQRLTRSIVETGKQKAAATRAIKVEGRDGAKEPSKDEVVEPAPKVKAAASDIIGRTAIKVEVQ